MDASHLSPQDRQALAAQYGHPSSGAERFPLVSTLSVFMRVLGFLLVVGGIIIFAMEFIPWIDCNPPKQPPQQGFGFGQPQEACPLSYVELGVGGAIFAIGLGIVAVGELLGVFRSIEGNTYNLLKVTQEADYKGRLAQGS
jgi:hypothetical protein